VHAGYDRRTLRLVRKAGWERAQQLLL
jgi:hypothetical protein